MKWINFLHFYQPPSINKDTIIEVTKNSYDFIVKILEENEKAKITANINASLLEHFDEYGFNDLIKKIHKLAQEGKIELVLSAAYHPVLTLIPKEEAIRQIEKGKKITEKFFPDIKIKGFFFPEMVYDKKVANYLKTIGIEWIILDELSYNGKFNTIDPKTKYIDKNSGLKILFRQRKFSRDYPPKLVLDELKGDTDIIISGTDAELYGDRHIDFTGDFYHAVRSKNIECQTGSDFLSSLRRKKEIRPKTSSWDTEENELINGEALYLWKNPNNKIHLELWKLTKFALDVVEKNKEDENYKWARWRLDRGLSSCVYWWASEKKFPLVESARWHPDQISIGAKDLVRSIRSLSSISRQEKIKAEKFYLKILKLTWEKHWEKYYEASRR